MGIELPPELAGVAAQAGVVWPEADEETMARSAQAWRDAATSMTTLTTDADNTVRSALSAVHGDTGTAATRHWRSFVEPDSGHLTGTVRGMTAAADRLEHAADQVGTAKVEIVRNLVSLAQNSDAAHTAAAAGHPTALAGLETAVRGTSANVANIETNLVSAVQPASGVDMAGVREPVNANPGTHGAHPLTALVDHTVAATTDTVTHTVTDTAQRAATLAGPVGAGPGHADPGGHGGPSGDPVRAVTNVVTDTTQHATGLVDSTARDPAGLVGAGPGGGNLVGDHGRGVTDVVGDTAQGAADLVGAPGHPPPHPGGVADQLPGNLDPAQPGHGNPDITGPVTIDRPGGPAHGDNAWPPGGDFADDRPTPPTGQTSLAGFAGADIAPAAAPAANLPPGAPPIGGAPAPGAGAAPGFGGGAGGPAFGGAPGFTGGPAPGAPLGGAPGGAVGVGPAPGAPAPGAPAAGGGAPAGQGAGARPADRPFARPPDAPLPEPRKGAFSAAAVPPGPAAAQPVGPAAPAAPARERDEALALFWIHMFPIGHMPVAADRPARQLPPPPAELDYAPGLRFAPGDHPRADLVDSAERRAELWAGAPPLVPSDALPADAPEVTALAEGHDPLGGEHERDWDRRYLVRFGSVTAQGISREGVEFAWPPGEQYPEGGSAPGEPEVLAEGVELDRFGRWEGRVFAAAGTPFAQRSLPPAHLEHGYRRYRVLRPLPVWRAVSAAWFAQTGGGVRYRTTYSALELLALGYLADVTREDP